MADAQDMVFGPEPDSIQMTPDQIAASSEIDPITEAIRKEVLAKQEEIMRLALIVAAEEEEKNTLRGMSDAEFRAYMSEEENKAKIREVLANEVVQGQLNEAEVVGYKKVHEQFKDSYHNISWDGQAKEGSRTQEIKRADGSVVASLTETTHATKPVTVELSNGQTQEISSYRTVDFPTKLDNGGPLHISMAVKDPSGKNISEENALYFSAHYSKEGKLMEISSPQPVKFAGDGDDAIGYIERNGQIYTLAVTQGQYNVMAKEVQQNKGMAVNISQQADKQAPDIAQTQQQDLPSQNLSPQNQDVTPQAGQEQANEADKPELTRQNANPNFPNPPAPEANNEPPQGQGQEQKEKEKEQREKEREKQEEQEEEKKKREEKEKEEEKSTKKPKKGKNKTRSKKSAGSAKSEAKTAEQQDVGGLVGEVMRKAGVEVDETDAKLIQQIQSNSKQEERDAIIEAIIENRPTKEYDALKKHESELKDAAQEVVINARQQGTQSAEANTTKKTDDALTEKPPGLETREEEKEAARTNAELPKIETEQGQAASQTQEVQKSQETQQYQQDASIFPSENKPGQEATTSPPPLPPRPDQSQGQGDSPKPNAEPAPPPPPPPPPLPEEQKSGKSAGQNNQDGTSPTPKDTGNDSKSQSEPTGTRGALLEDIKKGKKLNPVNEQDKDNAASRGSKSPDGLGGVISNAINKRHDQLQGKTEEKNPYENLTPDKAVEKLTETIKTGEKENVKKDIGNIKDEWTLGDQDDGMQKEDFKKAYDAAMKDAKDQPLEKQDAIYKAAEEILNDAGINKNDHDKVAKANMKEATAEALTAAIKDGKADEVGKINNKYGNNLEKEDYKKAYEDAKEYADTRPTIKRQAIYTAANKIREKAGVSDQEHLNNVQNVPKSPSKGQSR